MSIAKGKNASLVETIGAGYRTLNQRPWALAIPAAASAYLWIGPPVGLGQLGAQLQAALNAAGASLGTGREQLARGILSSDVRLALAWLNFMPVLAPPPRDAGEGAGLTGLWQLAMVFVLINVPALLLSSYFLTALSEAVNGERRPPLLLVRQALVVAFDIVRYLLVLAGMALVVALPLLALSALVAAAMPEAMLGILLTCYIALFWAYVYTGFAPEAILISRSGPLRAIVHSARIVRHDLAGTLGLLLLSFVIADGLGVIWQRIAVTPPGQAVAILGSAYVGSGLSAARLVFYRERHT